jgi:hypothetical protein
VTLLFGRERQSLERNRDRATVGSVSDYRGALAHADESGALVSVHHRLLRLKGASRPELQLQELRAGDRVQSERVHGLT